MKCKELIKALTSNSVIIILADNGYATDDNYYKINYFHYLFVQINTVTLQLTL